MLEFKVNEFITLKMISKETFIYIKGKNFIQCKGLIMNIPTREFKKQNKIKSIDDLEYQFSDPFEVGDPFFSPNEEFWAHCSVRHEAVLLNAET